jgi:hypothetical protein
MMRTTVLVVAALVVLGTGALAAEPWVQATFGLTTYDLSDVNDDLTESTRDFGFLHGEDQVIDSSPILGGAVGLRLGDHWNVGISFDRLPAGSTFDQDRRVEFDRGLSTDYVDYDVGASALYLTVDRLLGEVRDNPRVVYGVSGGIISASGELQVDILDEFADDPEEQRVGTDWSGTGPYVDAHLKVMVDLGRFFLEPEIAYRYARVDVPDYDETFLLDNDEEPIFDVEKLDYTGMVFRLGVGFKLGRR